MRQRGPSRFPALGRQSGLPMFLIRTTWAVQISRPRRMPERTLGQALSPNRAVAGRMVVGWWVGGTKLDAG